MDWKDVVDKLQPAAPHLKYRIEGETVEFSFTGNEPFTAPVAVMIGGESGRRIIEKIVQYPDDISNVLLFPVYCISSAAEMIAVFVARHGEFQEKIPAYGKLLARCFSDVLGIRNQVEKGGVSLIETPFSPVTKLTEYYGTSIYTLNEVPSFLGFGMEGRDPLIYRVVMTISGEIVQPLFTLGMSDEKKFNDFLDLVSVLLGITTEAVARVIEKEEWYHYPYDTLTGTSEILMRRLRRLIETIMPQERALSRSRIELLQSPTIFKPGPRRIEVPTTRIIRIGS